MQKEILKMIFSMLLSMLTKENFNMVVDKILDVIEDKALGDPSTSDDDNELILALCNKARALLNVPDND